MAYYQSNYYSDAGHYDPYNNYHYSNYQQHYYAPPQAVSPQPYYYYSDGFNCYQVINGYCYPVLYKSVAESSEMKKVELEDASMDLILDDGYNDDVYDDDDYDPTPYGGGYDIVQTYGKPLPASDSICYPRSGDHSQVRAGAAVVSDQQLNKAFVPVAVDADDFEFDNESDGESVSESCCDSEMSNAKVSGGNGLHDELSGGGGEYEKVLESDDAPNGYELRSERPGFYDGLYGYLPCLNKKKNITVVPDDGWVAQNDEDPWKAAADFIFGSLNPYAG